MNMRCGVFLCCQASISLLAASADAKCVLQRYRVEVEVRAGDTKEPVAGVQIAVFTNSSETEMPSGAVPKNEVTGTDGRLTRTYVFDTYSGSGILKADRCDAKIRTLEVVLTHPAYRARRVSLKPIRISADSVDGVGRVVVPPIRLDVLQP